MVRQGRIVLLFVDCVRLATIIVKLLVWSTGVIHASLELLGQEVRVHDQIVLLITNVTNATNVTEATNEKIVTIVM